MQHIKTRAQVNLLVKLFYSKVRNDEMLAPVFNAMITTEAAWQHHFEHLTDFWESNLFVVSKFKGNPLTKHIEVNQQTNNAITQLHFHRWLMLWNETVNENFEGETANLAKRKARNMASFLFLKMEAARLSL